jgi:hypothetical protein
MATNSKTISWAVALGLTLLGGCGSDAAKDDKNDKPASSGNAKAKGASSAATSSKEKTTCADFGGKGELTVANMCVLPRPSPVKGKWTGAYVTKFGQEQPEFEVENGFELEINWGNVALFYYDKDGNQLEVTFASGDKSMAPYQSGSGTFGGDKPGKGLEPGEKKKFSYGPTKAETPAGTETIELEVRAFGHELPNRDPKSKFFMVQAPDVPNVRPKGGWK